MATAAVVEYGFDEDRFAEPVSDNFKCGICFNVLNNPKSCQNNQHYFCFGCIIQHLKNYQTCPNCAEELTTETLGTPPRVLLNCISELRVKCDHVKRGCCDQVQLGHLQTHLDQCGFAPVTCGNDGCEMQINTRDKIHHETELCEFRRVLCHDCRELREEIVKNGTKHDQLNKSLAKLEGKLNEVATCLENVEKKQDQFNRSQAKLEGKLNEMTTRLENMEKNVVTQVNKLYDENQRENATVVQEISNIKRFMNDVLHSLSTINTTINEKQAATKQETQRNEREDLQDSPSKPSSSLKTIEHDPAFRQQHAGENETASKELDDNKAQILSNSSAAGDLISFSPRIERRLTSNSAESELPEKHGPSCDDTVLLPSGRRKNVPVPRKRTILSDSQNSTFSGYQRRRELLGQSSGENESRVQTAIAKQGVTEQDSDVGSETLNQEGCDRRQESRSVDLIEPSSGRDRKSWLMARDRPGGAYDRTSNDWQGSSDNLYASPTFPFPRRDLNLGYRVDHTATSPEESSPHSKQRSSPEKEFPFAPDTPQQIEIGMTVLVSRNRGKLSRGVVKFIGCIPDKKHQVCVGLELHDADGKHDGKFNGHRYFKCPPNRGLFVLFEKIVMAYT